MRWRREIVDGRYGGYGGEGRDSSGDELYFGEEEGESMVGFDMGRRERAERLGRGVDSERRLSRDLEEGFRDSDEESEEGSGDNRRR